MIRKHIYIGVSASILIASGALATFASMEFAAKHLNHAGAVRGTKIVAVNSPSPSPSVTPSPSLAPSPVVTQPTAINKVVKKNQVLQAGTRNISSLGIAAGSGLSALPAAEMNNRLDQMRALGVIWLRYDIEWANIEQRGRGEYNWTDYDRLTTAAVSRGFKVIGIIDYTPPWARLASCSSTSACAPSDPETYGAFAGIAARHYASLGIHHWEIWNEPNNRDYFQPAADPARYTLMLRSAYTQIKAADPSAVVITGGLSPADTGGGYISPIDFLNGMYRQGARGYFDAVGDHPYSFPFLVSRTNPDSAWGQMKSMHASMVANGDGGKKIWITEFGAPTGGPGGGPVSEVLQAQMLSEVVAQIRTLPWVGPFMWYSFKDAGTSRDTVENFFGLLRADGSRKPAYEAFKQAMH